MMAGYNAPARIDVRNTWDVFFTGSFIYWQPTEENLEVGISNVTPLANLGTDGMNGNVIDMNFRFKPGFQVGLGMNFDHDNWDGYAEYTWLRGTDDVSSNGPVDAGANILPFWGHPDNVNSNGYNTATGQWRAKFDFVDGEMARSYYVGTRLSFRPFVGARAAWIRQSYIARYVNDGGNAIGGTLQDVRVTNRTRSWGIGPRGGIGTNWMMGWGFRFFNDFSGDILYTRYTLQYEETDALAAAFHQRVKQKHIDYLRTHLDFEMGIGWGSYFDNNNWHIDLSAAYGFQVFFDQNMFRHYGDDIMRANSFVPNGNMYINGLTATLRVDF
jgi:hypothetical protein